MNHGLLRLLDLVISWVINHVTFYKFDSSHWLKSQHSGWREHSGWRALKSITGHVIYNPAYN